MKYHEPRLISLITALVVTVLYIILFVTGSLIVSPGALHHLYPILFLLASAALLLAVSFLVFRFTLEKFIYSKIRLVYKTIHHFKTRKAGLNPPRPDSRFLEEVNREVEQWQQEKSREIEQLRLMEQYRREFIGNISHEIKTPLFHIQGYILTLLDGGLEDPTINREYLLRTEKNIERLIRIVEDLDEISQLESGQIKLNITRFDIHALAREAVELLEGKAARRGVRLTLEPQERPVFVEGDREKIRQVLTNLLENSIRYGSRNGTTRIAFFDMDEHILTEVADDGMGIDPVDLPRVFERFYRSSRARSVFAKGKGLGLAIVKHILEAHQQTIHARSSPGAGTTFGFTLKKPVC